jgi:hypothetical protein
MDILEEKKEELRKMKKLHESMWKDYGSELSAGHMSAKEEALEAEIKRIEQSHKQSDHNQV